MVIVPGRVTATSALFWVMTTETEPERVSTVRASLAVNALGSAAKGKLSVVEFDLPIFSGQCTVWLGAATQLSPSARYVFSGEDRFSRDLKVSIRTLPETFDEPVTVTLGSCFSLAGNKMQSEDERAHRVYASGKGADAHFRVLCGDQIYMDLPDYGFIPATPQVASKYVGQWLDQGFRAFIAQSPNLMTPDDHEFWNDFPAPHIAVAGSGEGATGRLAARLLEALRAFQLVLNLDASQVIGADSERVLTLAAHHGHDFDFAIPGSPGLAFRFLDTRSLRAPRNTPGAGFTNALGPTLNWIANLNGPGVLVTGQPIYELAGGAFDSTLASYPSQFDALVQALLGAPHKVLVMSGDVHYSRCIRISDGDREFYELVSSPLARIPTPTPLIDSNWIARKEGERISFTADTKLKHKVLYLLRNADTTFAKAKFMPGANGTVTVDVSAWHYDGTKGKSAIGGQTTLRAYPKIPAHL